MGGQIEEKKSAELENTVRIRGLENTRQLLQERLKDKSESAEEQKTKLNDFISEQGMLKREMKDAEVREGELFTQQQYDRETVGGLTSELSDQEKQHVADARAVKLKISQLQDALQEKVNTVDQLSRATQATRAKAKQLQDRLEQTEAEASQAQNTFEQMLDEEQRAAHDLRQELEQITRQETLLRSAAMQQEELLHSRQALLGEKTAESEILQHEAFSKDRQAKEAQSQVEKLTVQERDRLDTLNDLEETLVELKLQQRERVKEKADLVKQLKTFMNENRLMKKQVAEKMKAERILMAELEAKRLKITSPRGKSAADVKAHKQAEEEFEVLLHGMNKVA